MSTSSVTRPVADPPPLPYRLGLPAWAFPGWRDRYFTARPSALASYATVFNAVEANTSFYRVPGASTIASWREAVGGRDFRFCFKLPSSVTHERSPDFDELARFLAAIEPLGEHLGPLLLQFPARLGPDRQDDLRVLLERLPAGLQKVIEVRHPAYFHDPGPLGALLDEFGCSRVVLDTRAIYEGDRQHPAVRDAQHEKPDVPVLPDTGGALEYVRLVLHPDLRDNQRYIDEWAVRTAAAIRRGADAWVMIHCPDDQHCPLLARTFHETLCRTLGGAIPALPPWPVPQQATWL